MPSTGTGGRGKVLKIITRFVIERSHLFSMFCGTLRPLSLERESEPYEEKRSENRRSFKARYSFIIPELVQELTRYYYSAVVSASLVLRFPIQSNRTRSMDGRTPSMKDDQ
jgi:hypothetical protein